MTRLSFILLFAVFAAPPSCGPMPTPNAPDNKPPIGFGGSAGTAASSEVCSIPRGETRPFVVEWDAARRNEVKQLVNDGVLLVEHTGCGLKILDGCTLEEQYAEVHSGGARDMDSFRIGSTNELKARLPLGYVELSGEFRSDDQWTLEYVFGDSKKARIADVLRTSLPRKCEKATHFVSRIMLGAYRLRTAASTSGSAGAGNNNVGLNGSHTQGAEIIREGGDFDRCRAPATASDDAACLAIVQIFLKEIVADGEPGSGSIAAVAGPPVNTDEAAVNTDTDAGTDVAEETLPIIRADEIQEPGTQAVWLRCAIGETWTDESGCTGEKEKMNWSQASTACPEGYRLPERADFVRLLGGCDSDVQQGRRGRCLSCERSSTCRQMFADDENYYWSSTPGERAPAKTWYIDFDYGAVNLYSRDGRYATRCLRAD